MSRGVEFSPETVVQTETIKPRYYPISPTKLELLEATKDIPPDEILKHHELYTPTKAELYGAIRGMHGHAITNIATHVIRELRSEDPLAVALAPSKICSEWKEWSENMSFMRRSPRARKLIIHDGYVFGQDEVKDAWRSKAVTSFAQNVIEAHRFGLDNFVANGYCSPEHVINFDPTDPGNSIAIEQDHMLHIDFGGDGITVNLRADCIIYTNRGPIIIDYKFGRDFDPQSAMAILQAGMYALVVDRKTKVPHLQKARANKLSMGNTRFLYAVFVNHPQNPHFEYHEVKLPETRSYWVMLSPYLDRLSQCHEIYKKLAEMREGAYYLPVPISEIDDSYVAQPTLL